MFVQELSEARVAVVGLGLMGGSLALALRGRCKALLGVDHDAQTCARAVAQGVVDAATTEAADILPDADVIVLAVPVDAIITYLDALPDLHPGRALVFDLGSSKAGIVAAMAQLPPRLGAIGGHPMCGKAQLGLAQAEAGLYQDAPFALVETSTGSPAAHAIAVQIIEAAGGVKIEIDAATHDRWVAATSHVPYLVSAALALATPPESAPLAGSGFASSTRLAGTPYSMIGPVLHSNREAVLKQLRAVNTQLEYFIESLAQENETDLEEMLLKAAKNRKTIIS